MQDHVPVALQPSMGAIQVLMQILHAAEVGGTEHTTKRAAGAPQMLTGTHGVSPAEQLAAGMNARLRT